MLVYGVHDGQYSYRYVGLTTKSVEQRFSEHLSTSDVLTTPFYCWLKKHKDVARVEVLETCATLDELSMCEQKWIAILRSTPEHRILNLTDGGIGCLGYRWTEKQRAGLANRAHRGPRTAQETEQWLLTHRRNLELGLITPHKVPEERKLRIANSLRKVWSNDEFRQAQSDRLKGRKFTDEHKRKLGIASASRARTPLSEEHRKKISSSNLGRNFTEKHREALSKAGKRRIKCVECGMISAPGPIGRHQNLSGHTGKIEFTEGSRYDVATVRTSLER